MGNSIFLIGVFFSFLIYLLVGVFAGKSVKNVSDYYVSGRNVTTALMTGTLFASMLSVNGFMGDQGWSYSGNITSLVLLNSICSIGYVVGPLVFGRYLRRSKSETMPEYFGNRYNNYKNRRVSAIITVISLTAYLLASITGVGILMQELTGLSYNVCLFIAWLSFTLFTFYSGSKGVIITDTMMFLIFITASIISGPYIFKAQGGIGQLLQNIMENPNAPANILDYHGNIAGTGSTTIFGALMYSITMGIIWMITVSISPWQAGRSLMAKNEHVIFRSGALSAILTVVFLFYLNMQSVAVLNINPFLDDPQKVLIWASFNVIPKILGTLVLTGIMAAGLSSASTFLSVVGFSVTNDIFNIKFKNDKQKLMLSRITMILFGVLALFLAYLGLGGVRIIAWFASTIIASSWVVPGIGSIFSKKLSSLGARWSMIAGFVGFIIPKALVEFGVWKFNHIFINLLDPFFIGVFLSLIFAIIGSKIEPVSKEEIEYREKMLILPESEKDINEYKKDKKFAYLLIICGVLITIVLLLGWALPYMLNK